MLWQTAAYSSCRALTVQLHAADRCLLLFFGSPRHSWPPGPAHLGRPAAPAGVNASKPPAPCATRRVPRGPRFQLPLAAGISQPRSQKWPPRVCDSDRKSRDFPHLQDLQLCSEGRETALLGNATFHMQSLQPRNVKRLLPSTNTAPSAVTDISSSPTTNILFCQYFSPEFTRNVELKWAIGF